MIFRFLDVTLTDGIVANREASLYSPVDGIEIKKEVFDNILLRSTNQRITASYSFSTVINDVKTKVNLLNGERFVELVNSIISSNYNGLILGHKTVFGSMSCL